MEENAITKKAMSNANAKMDFLERNVRKPRVQQILVRMAENASLMAHLFNANARTAFPGSDARRHLAQISNAIMEEPVK